MTGSDASDQSNRGDHEVGPDSLIQPPMTPWSASAKDVSHARSPPEGLVKVKGSGASVPASPGSGSRPFRGALDFSNVVSAPFIPGREASAPAVPGTFLFRSACSGPISIAAPCLSSGGVAFDRRDLSSASCPVVSGLQQQISVASGELDAARAAIQLQQLVSHVEMNDVANQVSAHRFVVAAELDEARRQAELVQASASHEIAMARLQVKEMEDNLRTEAMQQMEHLQLQLHNLQ